MGIVGALIVSIIIKAFSAILEIGIQLIISNGAGVNGYGEYTFMVSLIEGAYYAFYSANVKVNTFYLSLPENNIDAFKRKYLFKYVLPVFAGIFLFFSIWKRGYGVIAAISVILYLFAWNASSTLMARGKQLPALLGEYLSGRLAILIGIIIIFRLNLVNGVSLLTLYGLQYLVCALVLEPVKRKIPKGIKTINVSLKKVWEYQLSDIQFSIIAYIPAVLQFIFVGSKETGFIGIVAIVKKIANFVAGPTAKVFLPEFSRLYNSGKKDELCKKFLVIVKIQMIFISAFAVALLGASKLFLHYFNSKYEEYSLMLFAVSLCLLIVASIGPVDGIMQMTGNEKVCNRNNWISIVAMVAVMIAFNKSNLFTIFGIIAQASVYCILNFYSISKWIGKPLITLKDYCLLWFPTTIAVIALKITKTSSSIFMVITLVLIVLVMQILLALKDPEIQKSVLGFIGRMSKKRNVK